MTHDYKRPRGARRLVIEDRPDDRREAHERDKTAVDQGGTVLALWLPGVAAGAAEMPKLLGDAQPKHGGSVVYGIESDIPSLDPHITFGGSNKRVVMSVFEGLVERDRGNVDPEAKPFVRPEIVPVLAESGRCSTTASAIGSSCARA